MVKKLPAHAEDADSIPSQGTKIPHAIGQLSPRATTTKPMHHIEDPVQQKIKLKKKKGKEKIHCNTQHTPWDTGRTQLSAESKHTLHAHWTTASLQKRSVLHRATPSSRVCSQWNTRFPPLSGIFLLPTLQPGWGFPVTSSCQI